MKIGELNEWLTLAANIGVLAGIIFLAVEIQQNSRMMSAQTRSDVSGSILNIIEMEMNPNVVAARIKLRSGADLDIEDEYYLSRHAMYLLRTFENTYYQYQQGLYSEEEFLAESNVWRGFLNNEYINAVWRNGSNGYTASFQEYIDSLIQ